MTALDASPDDVLRLVQLAREFHAKEAVSIPEEGSNPADDWPAYVLADHAEDTTLGEFRSIISDMDRDQQTQVVALLWLGRGDYEPEEWNRLLEDAGAAWNEHTADYLIAHPMLADHLEEGLQLLEYDLE